MTTLSRPPNRSDFAGTQLAQGLDGSRPTDLRSLAIQALEANPTFRGRMALGAIQIESVGDTLVVNGKVPTYYLKQLLQEALRRVDGVRQIENQVAVVAPFDSLANSQVCTDCAMTD